MIIRFQLAPATQAVARIADHPVLGPPEFAEHGALLAANLLEGEQDLPGSLTLFAHGNLVAIRYADEKLDEFVMRQPLR